MLAKLVA